MTASALVKAACEGKAWVLEKKPGQGLWPCRATFGGAAGNRTRYKNRAHLRKRDI